MYKEDFESLAAIQHEIWSHWMHYLFTTGFNGVEGYTVPSEKVERWQRQMNTDYKDLTEKEKESDRVQVRKFIELITVCENDSYNRGFSDAMKKYRKS